MTHGRPRTRSRSVVVVALGAVALVTGSLLGAGPAAAQEYPQPQPTIDGAVITGMYAAPDNQPFFAAGYQLTPENAANVAGITCPGTGTPNLTGGPGGSPECLFATPVTSATVMLTGRSPWPSTVSLTPFYSLDNRTYVMAPSVTASTPARLAKLTDPTVLTCTGGPVRIVHTVDGQPVLAPPAAGDPTAARVAVYAGAGSEHPDGQFAADVDADGNARSSGLCTPSSEKPPKSSRQARRAARKAAAFACDTTDPTGVVVDPHSDRIQVIKDGKVVFDASISGKPSIGYDKKACRPITIAK